MEAHAEAADHLTLCLGHRHDGRHGGHALVLGAGHLVDFVHRLRLDVETLRQLVDTLRGALQEGAVFQVVELRVAFHAADAAMAFGRADRLGGEDGAVEVVVALLEVLQHLLGTVDTIVEQFRLAAELSQLALHGTLRGRLHNLHSHNHYQHAQHHTEEDIETDALHLVAQRHKDLLILQRMRVETVGMALSLFHCLVRGLPSGGRRH